MSSASQIDLLPAAAIAARHPMVTLDVAVVKLQVLDHAAVMRRIEEGGVEWAFDISSPLASWRSEVRIFWRCLVERGIPEREVYGEIIPSHWGRVSAETLRLRFMCSAEMITTLIDTGAFVKLTDAHVGPGGSPEVTRESVIEFLKNRRMCACQSHEPATQKGKQ